MIFAVNWQLKKWKTIKKLNEKKSTWAKKTTVNSGYHVLNCIVAIGAVWRIRHIASKSEVSLE